MALPAPTPDAAVVVTGASAGIGEALARELASRGHCTVLVARREERLEALAGELRREYDVEAHTLAADLGDRAGRGELVERIDALGLTVAGLCNNAGCGLFGPFQDADPERERAIVELNVVASHDLTLRLVPGMVARGEGAVLNVGSIVGAAPLPGQSTYSATKAFLATFSEAVHTDLAGTGVSCTLVSPGPTRTEIFDVSGAGDMLDDAGPLDLFFQDADEVAREAIDAMEQGDRVTTPGVTNQAYETAARHLPHMLTLPVASALDAGRKLPGVLRALRLRP